MILTHRTIIEATKTVQYFSHDRRPSRDVFRLRITAQLVEVLQHAEAQPENNHQSTFDINRVEWG